ncbi:MAG: hypothetical protein ACI9ON_002050 [Limisphaerales bacterium]
MFDEDFNIGEGDGICECLRTYFFDAMKPPIALFLILSLIASSQVYATTPVMDWHFSPEVQTSHQEPVKLWLSEVQSGLQRMLGPPPIGYDIHIKHRASNKSPVPWAHTMKAPRRQVHFFIDPRHEWSQFRADWTAAHELTHMLFPYLGRDRWFAEGIASYLQYQVMFAAGHMTWQTAITRIQGRFDRVMASRVPEKWSVLKHNRRLRQQPDFPRLYWGGAAYFAIVDRRLWQSHEMRLADVIQKYTQCCFTTSRKRATDMIRVFDRISETDIFLTTYREEMLTDGVPNTEGVSAWLEEHPPELE